MRFLTVIILSCLIFTGCSESFQSIKERAMNGDVEAQGQLGVMYAKGDCVEQDYKEAAKWYQKAAEQGDAKAQGQLGEIYFVGLGFEQDYKEAARWYLKAAEKGGPKSLPI